MRRVGLSTAMALTALILCLGVATVGTVQAAGSTPAPRIMVVVPEMIYGRQAAEPAAETEIIRILVAAGYRVIDQQQYASNRYTPEMDLILQDPTGPEARAITARTGADILIVGKATGEPASSGHGSISARAELSLRAVRVKAAEILAADHQTASGADISADVAVKIALRNAGGVCAAALIKGIGQRVGGPTASPAAPETQEAPHKPRFGVIKFEDNSGWCRDSYQLSKNIPHVLAMQLRESGQFEVVEMTDIDDIKDINASLQDGTYDGSAGRGGELGGLKRPDYVIKGRIAEFRTESVDISTVTDVLRDLGGLLGGSRVGLEKASVTLQVEVVELRTGEIVASCEASENQIKPVLKGTLSPINVFTEGDKSAAAVATRKAVRAVLAGLLEQLPREAGGATCCPSCHKVLKPGAAFCTDCGKKAQVGPRACPSCGAEASATAKFCGQCGTTLKKK